MPLSYPQIAIVVTAELARWADPGPALISGSDRRRDVRSVAADTKAAECSQSAGGRVDHAQELASSGHGEQFVEPTAGWNGEHATPAPA
jgi:hypothetical protein